VAEARPQRPRGRWTALGAGSLPYRLEIDALRNALSARWDRQMATLGAPSSAELGAKPETRMAPFAADMRRALDWWGESWAGCEARIEELGLDWDRLTRQAAGRGGLGSGLQRIRELVLHDLPPVIEARTRYLDWREQRDRKAPRGCCSSRATRGATRSIR
jgi:hypothetical protein